MSILRSRTVSGLAVMGVLTFAALAAVLISANAERAAANPPEIAIYTIDSQQVMEAHPAFQEAVQQYQQRMMEFQQELQEADEEHQMLLQQQMQQRMQEVGAELQQEAFDTMRADVQKIADEQGYDYVIDSNVMIVGGEDITDEVLEKIAAEAPEVEEEPELPEMPIAP